MKKVLLLLIICVNANVFSQGYRSLDREIVENGDLTKNEYWINLKTWVSNNFQTYERVVDMEDADAGTMILKVSAGIPVETTIKRLGSCEYLLCFNIKVDCRDGRFRVTISSVYSKIITSRAPSSLSFYPTNTIKEFVDDGDRILKLSKKYFGNELTWNINDAYFKALDETEDLVTKLEDDMSKINTNNRAGRREFDSKTMELDKLKKDHKLLSDIYSMAHPILELFVVNLVDTIKIKDDF